MSHPASPTSMAPRSAKEALRRHYTQVRKQIPRWRQEEARHRLSDALAGRIVSVEGEILSFETIGSEIRTDRLNALIGDRLRLPEMNEGEIVLEHPPALIFVPGLAFDSTNHRLGYGKGCYDRLLARFPHVLTYGLGFAEQLSAIPLPVEPHDHPLKEIVLV